MRLLLGGLLIGALSIVLGLVTLALTAMRQGSFAASTAIFVVATLAALIFGLLIGSSELAVVIVEQYRADKLAVREQERLNSQWFLADAGGPDQLKSSIDQLKKAHEDKHAHTLEKVAATQKRSKR